MLQTGTKLGPYDIQGSLGAGGMGEVYRARDTRLGRDVALKILPDALAQDRDALARFEREAQILASLNHPNIATLHGVEESSGIKALIMELVEGPTLAEIIVRGPLPLPKALAIAQQIADALAAAHAAGVVHRDLKPANIKVHDARVKVLDFGLAKALDRSGPQSDLSHSPTISSPMGTRSGVVLGTAAYMAPEQARGEVVDDQADIWAFGCVLYEMLAGRAAFKGRSVSDVIADILRSDPDWTTLPPDLHPRIRLLLERCLEKDVASRYHSIADARVDVQHAMADPRPGTDTPAGARTAATSTFQWVAALVAIAAVGAAVAIWVTRPTPDRAVRRFADVLPQDRVYTNAAHPLVAVSRDGSSIAYVANNRLFLRSSDRLDAQPLAGSEGSPTTPFFSPDGRFVGYFDLAAGELRRLATTGGTPVVVTKATNLFGARWEADDSILYGQEDGVWRVSANGGAPARLVEIKPGERVHGPQLLPDGDSMLFTLRPPAGSRQWEQAQVVVQSLRTGERKTIRAGSDARYLSSGHLIYALGSVLLATAFDLTRLESVGGPIPVADGIRRASLFPGRTGTANYDISDTGVLVYAPGTPPPPVPRQLVAVDRTGQAETLVPERRDYWRPRVSPDGSRIAVEVRTESGEHIWIVDVKDRTASALVTESVQDVFAAWTRDGRSVIFRASPADRLGAYIQPADGSAPPELLHPSTEDVMVGDVSRDSVLVFATGEQTGQRSIWTLPLAGSGKGVVEFLATPALEHMPVFSPDGKWIAYASNESGRSEVYVRPYPRQGGTVRRISESGATAPVWAPDGTELFYRNASGNLMATPMRLGAGVGPARELFRVQGRFRTSGNAAAYDIDPTGRRFIMVTEPDTSRVEVREIVVVLNWHEELKRLVPAK